MFTLSNLILAGAIALAPAATDVRVRILQDAQPIEVRVSVESGSFTLGANDLVLATLGPGDEAQFTRTRSGVGVRHAGQTRTLRNAVLATVETESTFRLTVTRGQDTIARTYSGALDVRIDVENDQVLLLVNHAPLEAYVAAVVTSEYGLDDVEGRKAMAILARTYALRSLAPPGSEYDHVDSELSQVYKGLAGLDPEAIRAATETTGQVLLFNGALAEAVYHAESGGHTADNDDVWNGEPVAYLRGVPDPFANNSPYASWSFFADRPRLLSRLSAATGSEVRGFVISHRSADGRVARVRLLLTGGTDREVEISGNDFRLAVLREFGASSLRSMLFDVAATPAGYRFTGAGFGHGVGLSQWGAHEMANRGYAYDEIIAFYFRGTELAHVPNLIPQAQRLTAQLPTSVSATQRADSVSRGPGPPRVQEAVSGRRRGRIGW